MEHENNELNRTPDSEVSSPEPAIGTNGSMTKILAAFVLFGSILGAVLGWTSLPEITLSNEFAVAFSRAVTGYKEELIDFVLNGAVLGSIGGLFFACGLLLLSRGVNNFVGGGAMKTWLELRSVRRMDIALIRLTKKENGKSQSEILLSIGEGIYIRGEVVDFDKHAITVHNKHGTHTIRREFVVSVSALCYKESLVSGNKK